VTTAPKSGPTAPVKVSLARTYKLSVPKSLNPGKRASIEATHNLYRKMVVFFADFFMDHTLLVDAGDAKAALTAYEQVTLAVPERKVAGKVRSARMAMDGWDFELF